MWISHTIFLSACRSVARSAGCGQVRDDHAVPLTLALQQFWPQTLVGCASLGLVLASQPCGAALCAAAGRRAGVVGPACGDDGMACGRRARSRVSASAGCPRRPSPPRIFPRWRCPRSSRRATPPLTEARPSRCSALRTARGVPSGHFAFITATAQRAAAMDRLYRPVRQAAAISCSTSARMSATASPRSGGSVRAWSRSSRSRRW